MDGHLLRFRTDVRYAFVDLETFNLCLHFQQNRPWQVGVLDVVGEKIVGAHDVRVVWPDAPHLKVGREAAIITRFDEAHHLTLAVNPKPAFDRFWPILKKADYIVMHNGLKFDLYLLKGYAEMMGVDWKWIVPKIIDTKAIAQGYKLNYQYNAKKEPLIEYQYRMANNFARGVKTRLEVLGKEFEIEHNYDLLHDAIVDLELNLKVWNRLKTLVEI
jgi:hypothetical protein